MVWREAPALADPFLGALKSGLPPTATLRPPAGAKRLWRLVVTYLGGERERGVWNLTEKPF